MSIAQHLINLAGIICAALILWRAEQAISRMSHATHWMIRYAMLLLAGAAIGFILSIPGAGIDPNTLAVLAGIALLLICERRVRYLVRQRPGVHHA